ncbi:MAG: hypothetical protein GY846_26925 [Deltaproteobacteria bacterium]|nr:hypothetical protein [Deltaproteobacteria bacterium]
MEIIKSASLLNRFSTSELYGLLLAILGISVAFAVADRSLEMFFISLFFFGPSFALHEMGHKFAAEAQGRRAEFKLFPYLLLLSIMVSSIGFTLVVFGAVYFECEEGETDGDETAKIYLSGPLVNIGLAVVFLLFYVAGSPLLQWIGFWGVWANAFIGAFNLLPIPPLDGYQVFLWNKRCWALCFLSALALLALVIFIPF